MKVESGKSQVAQSCLTLSDPMDCSLPGSSIHGIFRATALEWGAIAFSCNLYSKSSLLTYFICSSLYLLIPSVQFSRSVVSNSLQSHGLQHSRPPWSITTSQSLLKLMSFELVMPSNHLILGRPLLLLPSILSSIGVFSNESVLHIRWPKYWSFRFSISPSNVWVPYKDNCKIFSSA